MLRNVANEVVLLARLLGKDALPEIARLHEIILRQLALELDYTAIPVLVDSRRILTRSAEILEAGWVVGSSATQALVIGSSIATQRVEAVLGAVNGQLDEVGAEAVALGILVRKGPELEDCQSYQHHAWSYRHFSSIAGTYLGQEKEPSLGPHWQD